MAMTRVESALAQTFAQRSSMSKRELMEAAEQVESPALLRDAYSTLTAKGVLLEDDWGVVSINRQRAKQVMEQDWLYDPLYSEE